MRISRHDFSGGLIGDELKWRSDLEGYNKSLSQCSNMLPTPYGGVRRRPPLVSIGTLPSISINVEKDTGTLSVIESDGSTGIDITVDDNTDLATGDIIFISGTSGYDGPHTITSLPDTTSVFCSGSIYGADETISATWRATRNTVYYPKDARAFDFTYSADYRYIAIFVTYEADGEDDIGRIVVQNTSGTQKAFLNSPYSQQEVLELDVHHSNDKMWIAHQNHYPRVLTRSDDTNWSLFSSEINGGPFLDENKNQDIKATTGIPQYDSTFQYLAGDVVVYSGSTTGTVSWIGTVFSYISAGFRSDYTDDAITLILNGYAFTRTWSIDSSVACYSPSVQLPNYLSQITKLWYPYTIIRVDNTFAGLVSIGDEISFNIDFDESGGDTNYIKNTTIEDIWTGTSFSYLKINLGWVSAFSAKISDQYFNHDNLYHPFFDEGSEPTIPSPNVPSVYQSYWENYNWESGPLVKPTINQDVYNWNHLLVGIYQVSGGAYVTASTNISSGADYTSGYTALSANIGVALTETSVWEPVSNPTTSSLLQLSINSGDVFSENDIGRIIYIDKADQYSIGGTLSSTTATEAVFVVGTIRLIVSDVTSINLLVLEKSTNEGKDWEVIGNLSDDGVIEREIEDRRTQVRVRVASLEAGGSCKYRLEFPDGYSTIYSIVSYESDSRINVRVISGTKESYSSHKWALGSWGGDNGYPGCVTVYEDRLWFSGSKGEPFKHWGSVVGKYWNFAVGTFATSALIFQARADSSTRISWTEPKDNLFFGTDFGEYSSTNLDQTEALSASNPPKIDRHTTSGSARIPAVLMDNALAFISADKKKMKMLRYDAVEQDGYRSYDMTWRNPDVSGSGFIGHCLQRTPYQVLWLWTADGNAVSFTFDREHNVIGWAEHSIAGGLIKSLCVVPDENGIDEIYAVVYKTDLAISVAGTASPDPSGNYYFSGASVGPLTNIYIDGGDWTCRYNQTNNKYYLANSDGDMFESSTKFGTYAPVSGSGATGSVDVLATDYHIWKMDYSETRYMDGTSDIVGYGLTIPMLSIMEPTPLSRGPNFLEGNMKFRSARGFIYVVDSNGGEISVDGGSSWDTLDYSKLTADANGLYTGMIEFRAQSGYVDYSTIQVRTFGTDPLNITAISLEVEKHERKVR